MPKIANCLKCLKLRYSIDYIKTKKQGIILYSFTDFWFLMLKMSGVFNNDGAKRLPQIFNFQFRFIRVRRLWSNYKSDISVIRLHDYRSIVKFFEGVNLHRFTGSGFKGSEVQVKPKPYRPRTHKWISYRG